VSDFFFRLHALHRCFDRETNNFFGYTHIVLDKNGHFCPHADMRLSALFNKATYKQFPYGTRTATRRHASKPWRARSAYRNFNDEARMAQRTVYVSVFPPASEVRGVPWPPTGKAIAGGISAVSAQICSQDRRRLRMKGGAMSGQRNYFAMWLNDSSALGISGDAVIAQTFQRELKSGRVDVGPGLNVDKRADNTAQLLSTFREFVGLILDAQFGGSANHVYLIAYDFGVAKGLCGADSAAASGIRKGLADAIHVSPEEVSQRVVGKSIELGRRHGMLVHQLMDIRQSYFYSY
jgi:hypothetical protein